MSHKSQMNEAVTAINAVVEANTRFAASFDQAFLQSLPSRRLAVLTCMDARLHPEQFLGLHPGDAHVIANAGGRASQDAIRSLVVSTRLLGTRELMVIHHTDCGMGKHTDAGLRQKLQDEAGVDTDGVEFLCFGDLHESVREDVRRLRESPLLDDALDIQGFVYDVRTGRLQRVSTEAE